MDPTSERYQLLKDIFGYTKFRLQQEKIVDHILKKKDTLIIMPTGSGKSLCYQLPALLFPGLTVVISPLISLMQDQVFQLREMGVNAAFLNSSLNAEEYNHVISQVVQRQIELLYMAPETVLKPNILQLLTQIDVDSLAIDEAHCISEWGHDFRPEYRQLAQLRSMFPSAVCVASTATATPRVQQDIINNLQLSRENLFLASFDRDNLFLDVQQKKQPLDQLYQFVKRFPDQSGIIYCNSRRQVDELTEILQAEGFNARPYHAGLPAHIRSQNQQLFIRDDLPIIVATIAFGMGINKPNVRFILHYDLPKNIESYYQQIGRAGRDGLPAHCLLLFSYQDLGTLRFFIEQKNQKQEKIAAEQHLQAILSYAEAVECRRKLLLSYFGEQYQSENCAQCDICIYGTPDEIEVTIAAQKFFSCVKRTGEIFGANHLIDILRGSKSARIIEREHHLLSTYGIGTEFSKKEWQLLARQFIQKGYLKQDLRMGGLSLSQSAYAVFRNEEQVTAALVTTISSQETAVTSYHAELYGELRQLRKKLADERDVPPYAIFPDQTLMEMATYFPQDNEQLLQLHGVGEIKLQRYGSLFLQLIIPYTQKYHLTPRSKKDQRPKKSLTKKHQKRKYIRTSEAYNQGQSISDILIEYQIKQSTLFSHFLRYLQDGHTLRTDELDELIKDTPGKDVVWPQFEKIGPNQLKPIFEALHAHYSYDHLRLLQLAYFLHNPVEKED